MTRAATERLSLKQRLHAREGRGRVWVCGHRGAMGHCPENTMASFERGLELGADWVELDVHLSRDEALIVIHDETLDRTTNGHGLVREHSLAELRTLDAGGGQRIPTLDEVLAWARERETIVDIEIKNAPVYYAGIEQKVVAAVRAAGMTESVIVISFDHLAVRRVHELDPNIATGVLYGCRPTDGGVGLARAAGADAVLPYWTYVLQEDVEAAHAAGLAVAPWATSDPTVLRRLLDYGVDSICTNHPDILRDIVVSARKSRGVGGVPSTGGQTSRANREEELAHTDPANPRDEAAANRTAEVAP